MSLGKLEVTQGGTLDFTCTFTDDAGSAVNITGGTVVCKSLNCATVIDTKTITSHTTPISGITTISFSAAETALWPVGVINYEIQLTTAASKVYMDTGIIEVKRNY